MSAYIDVPDAAWRKSKRSSGQGQCVEVADVTAWRKSSRSSAVGQCVEVADTPDVVAVRDSKNPDGPKLAFDRAAWRAFAGRVKDGTYNL